MAFVFICELWICAYVEFQSVVCIDVCHAMLTMFAICTQPLLFISVPNIDRLSCCLCCCLCVYSCCCVRVGEEIAMCLCVCRHLCVCLSHMCLGALCLRVYLYDCVYV